MPPHTSRRRRAAAGLATRLGLSACLCGAGAPSPAQDLVLLSTNAIRPVLEEVLPRHEARAPGKVRSELRPAFVTQRAVLDGQACDAVLLPEPAIAVLAREGKLVTDSLVKVARSDLALMVGAGAPAVDIGSPEALRKVLLGADSFARHSEGASGVMVERLLDRLGIAGPMKAKTTLVTSGPVAAVVASGQVQLGAQQMSEVLPYPGVRPLGYLPAELQEPIWFVLGACAGTSRRSAVAALAAEFATPETSSTLKAKGMRAANTATETASVPGARP